jgi:hypothetical protein
LVWAFATVNVIAKSTSGSGKIQSRPNVLVIMVIALLPRNLQKTKE